jgi:hypothetical protein
MLITLFCVFEMTKFSVHLLPVLREFKMLEDYLNILKVKVITYLQLFKYWCVGYLFIVVLPDIAVILSFQELSQWKP